MLKRKKDKMLIFGDAHFPYHNPSALKWALNKVKVLQPAYIMQIGDLYDFYWFSKYPKKFLTLSPTEEVQKGRRMAETFWRKAQNAAPKAKCYQILGNHDDRPMKRVIEKFPEMTALFSMDGLFQFDGVKTNLDSRQEVIIKLNGQEISFLHGHLSQLGAHMNFSRMRTVVGHSHTGGVAYRKQAKEILWELNVGFLADEHSGPLQYGPSKRKKWTLGCGVIDEHGPRFIPYG
jgi:predicted phosphodiesterase